MLLENEDSQNIQNRFDVPRAKIAKANLEYKNNRMKQQTHVHQRNGFTSRLVVFNQMCATLGKNHSNKSYCLLWHEALGGHKAEALVDAMFKIIEKKRDSTDIEFWADN